MSNEHSMSVSAQSVDVTTVETDVNASNIGRCSWGELDPGGCVCPELPLLECCTCERMVHRLCMDEFERKKSSDATGVTIGENMKLCPTCHPLNQTTQKKKMKRITKQAKEKLRQYFTDAHWPRNKKLPKKNGDAALDKIIEELGLERGQVSRQLVIWKKDTYDKAQLQLLTEPDTIKGLIEENMSMTKKDFVGNVLDLLIDGEEVDGDANITNFIRSLDCQPHLEIKKEILQYMKDNKEHACFESLVILLGDLIEIMVEELPAMASMISVSEMRFKTRTEHAKKDRIKQWTKEYENITLHSEDKVNFDEAKFTYFGMYVANCLFFVWINSAAVEDLPPVEMVSSDENLVAKYSLPVIYYVAGWTLQRVSLAKTVALSKRHKYQQFSPRHNRGIDYAKTTSLIH